MNVGLAAPGRSAEHFARLLRERLGVLVLKSPIEAISLEAGNLDDLPERNGTLFDSPQGGEEWLRLVERLQARLGSDSVHGLDTHQDHRPERAWAPVSFGGSPGRTRGMQSPQTCPPSPPRPPRPLWLLDPPRPLAEGGFALLAGPERIESGWWDGAEACRDYFIARTGESSLAWIYRDRGGGWFLHGLFA